LKTKLMLTLVTLLAIGMLLISIVIIMFWQRHSLQSEVEKGTLFLQLAAASLKHYDLMDSQVDLSTGVRRIF